MLGDVKINFYNQCRKYIAAAPQILLRIRPSENPVTRENFSRRKHFIARFLCIKQMQINREAHVNRIPAKWGIAATP